MARASIWTGDAAVRYKLLLLLVFAATPTVASIPIPASLEQLACSADHILMGRVVAVDMIDAQGRDIPDASQGTGPGTKNKIRLHLEIEEVIVSTSKVPPRLLKVPLDPFMHYSLGQIRQAHSQRSDPLLVILRSENFEPIVPGAFLRSLDEKAEAVRLHKLCHP